MSRTLAARLDCVIGIMRHPSAGPLHCGLQDHVLLPTNRNLKYRLDEVTRSVRWHRLAAPFGVDVDCQTDDILMNDILELGEFEILASNHHAGDN